MADDEDDDLSVDWGAALAEDHNAPGLDEDPDMAAALADIEAEQAAAAAGGGGGAGGPTLGDALGLGDSVEAVYDVEVSVRAVLGMAVMPMSQILKLGRGAVVELDRGVGDPIDVYSSDQKIAEGEVVVVEDKLAVSIGDIMRSKRSL
ncbi:FliM/FliN family flagellar motor switch protein [Terasakiella sp. SH-1]|uniref:FliM/FliN family flagellar motor switch protein n=1 Tax=Terasakiella sp. SH-1 TaxID=2560057 RepID=UPI001F0F9BA2|nr:FliM/FliN family flagellar motor switch protein [Terasakiella sp. SH-1]